MSMTQHGWEKRRWKGSVWVWVCLVGGAGAGALSVLLTGENNVHKFLLPLMKLKS